MDIGFHLVDIAGKRLETHPAWPNSRCGHFRVLCRLVHSGLLRGGSWAGLENQFGRAANRSPFSGPFVPEKGERQTFASHFGMLVSHFCSIFFETDCRT